MNQHKTKIKTTTNQHKQKTTDKKNKHNKKQQQDKLADENIGTINTRTRKNVHKNTTSTT